jgi:hypothetical protein
MPILSRARGRAPLIRAAAVLLLFSFGSVTAVRAYCPMPRAGEAARAEADPHGCCKAGLSGTVPGCCHSDDAPAAATAAKPGGSAAPASRTCAFVAAPQAGASLTPAGPARSAHGSPPIVLRV